jgi:hypothetical protein
VLPLLHSGWAAGNLGRHVIQVRKPLTGAKVASDLDLKNLPCPPALVN